jgi:hemoglobin
MQANPHYTQIGGADRIRALVKRFYQLMDELPEASGIRKMHGADLHMPEEKLFKYLSGWMGGPQLYVQEFGQVRLHQRHQPFQIGQSERDQWLQCMNRALDDVVTDTKLRAQLSASFTKLANNLRNAN